jgi:hypothetical protein
VEKAKERSAASGHQDEEFMMELVISLCAKRLPDLQPKWHRSDYSTAVTAHQIRKLIKFSEAHSLLLPDSNLSLLSGLSDFASHSGSSGPRTPASSREYENAAFYYNINQQMLNKSQTRSHADSSLQDLAKEFGVDPHVVQALAQRLPVAGMC